jgi:hypothetical protein
MGDKYRGESQAEDTPGQKTRLYGREVSQDTFGDLGVAIVGLQHGLQTGFTERVETCADSCKQRAETHAANDCGGQLYTWNVQDLVRF